MSNSEGSARVFAGIATFFVVFFLPKLLVPIFEESSLTVLWGLVALAAAWVAVCLVSLKQRVNGWRCRPIISNPVGKTGQTL